jgi:hypothetical protein
VQCIPIINFRDRSVCILSHYQLEDAGIGLDYQQEPALGLTQSPTGNVKQGRNEDEGGTFQLFNITAGRIDGIAQSVCHYEEVSKHVSNGSNGWNRFFYVFH